MKHKVIELLDRLANYMSVPKKIKFTWIDYVEIYEYDEEHNWYFKVSDHVSFSISNDVTLTSEFEIVEEIEKPEEIELLDIRCEDSHYYIYNEIGTKCYLNTHTRLIAEQQNEIAKAINYLLKEEK